MVSLRYFLIAASLLVGCFDLTAQETGTIHVRIVHDVEVNDSPLKLKRWDYLISEMAFKTSDSESGHWIESKDWYGMVSALSADGRAFELSGLPRQAYSRIRFRIGLNKEANASDQNSWPPEHALNPLVNGLQWEWQGGYIFMALEGINQDTEAGFSYHLASDGNSVLVDLPIDFELKRNATITIGANINAILCEPGILPGRDSNSTHSREGDPVLPVLKRRIAPAFEVHSVIPELYQAEAVGGDEISKVYADSGLVPVTNRFPRVAFPPDNPLTKAGILLGKQLFHDPVLSRGEAQSCSSCHLRDRAFSDGKKLSPGVDGLVGKRNAMPLFNLAWHEAFFWDGRAKTIREQVLHPIVDPLEMGESLDQVVAKLSADAGFTAGFDAAFGDKQVTPERIALALEQFLLSLVSQDSKFDRASRGETELSPGEQRGLQLFVTEHDPAQGKFGADCFHCHGGNLFMSKPFANNGLDMDFTLDPGLGGFSGKSEEIGLFKTPSLRNIEVTGPYMHDSRFDSLEEVVEHYNSGVARSETLDPNLAKHPVAGLNLLEDDKAALVAFLKTLTDPVFLEIDQMAREESRECNAFLKKAPVTVAELETLK